MLVILPFITVKGAFNDPDDPLWTLVFRQKNVDSSTDSFFRSGQWRRNPDDPSANAYSVLDTLENYRDNVNDPITFKLVYPTLCEQNGDKLGELGKTNCNRSDGVELNYNIWQQTSNFASTTSSGPDGGVSGFTAVNLKLGDDNFNGLERGTHSLADGSLKSLWWWWCIGQIKDFGVDPDQGNRRRIPAIESFGISVFETQLWVYGPPRFQMGAVPEWSLIFRQDVSAAISFTPWNPDVLSKNTDPLVDHTMQPEFANLDTINGAVNLTTKEYGFKLVYPGLCAVNSGACDEFGTNSLIWTQFVNPAVDVSGVDMGSRVIYGPMFGDVFQGLKRGGVGDPGLLFSPGVPNAGFTIGPFKPASSTPRLSLPGPTDKAADLLYAQTVELYVWDISRVVKRCDYTTTYYRMPDATMSASCVPLTVCEAGVTFQKRAQTSNSDRVCAPVTKCLGNFYESSAPSLISDRVCLPLTTCRESSIEFEAVPPTPTTDRVCDRQPICNTEFQYQAGTGNKTSPRTCLKLSPECESGKGNEFERNPPTATTDRVCSTVKSCADGEYRCMVINSLHLN